MKVFKNQLDYKDLGNDQHAFLYTTQNMSYFSPSGKAKLKVEVKYCVQICEGELLDIVKHYSFTNKTEAKKHFKNIK